MPLKKRDSASGWRILRQKAFSGLFGRRLPAAACAAGDDADLRSITLDRCGCLGVQKPVQMDDEVPHVGVVDAGLCLGLPAL